MESVLLFSSNLFFWGLFTSDDKSNGGRLDRHPWQIIYMRRHEIHSAFNLPCLSTLRRMNESEIDNHESNLLVNGSIPVWDDSCHPIESKKGRGFN